MLITGMIRDQIHHNAHAAFLTFRQQRVEIRHRSEIRMDVVIIADVITVIGIGGTIYRREPDQIHAQILQMIQPAQNALEIADSIMIGILERARPDLIKTKTVTSTSARKKATLSSKA